MHPVQADTQRQTYVMYVEHRSWLMGWLRRRLDTTFDAADLAQDTFLRLMTGREAGAVNEPRALLTTIARGLVSNFHRRRRLEQAYLEVLAALPEPQDPGPEHRTIVLETLMAIDERLDRLAPRVRQAFLLSQLEGMRQSEIAAELKVSLATVQRYVALGVHACYFGE